MDNADRAERFELMLDHARLAGLVDRNSYRVQIIDVLANMMHYCDQEGIEFGSCLSMAMGHHNEEKNEEDTP